jgi:hypothetical protein
VKKTTTLLLNMVTETPANLMDPTLIPRCYAIQQVVTLMMPHIERSTFQWNWAYPKDRNDEVSPWHEAFVNARKWIDKNKIIVL